MRDRNSGFRSLGVWLVAGLFLGSAFTAGVASGADNAAFVSYSGVPAAMHPGDTATVTVTMRNTGTTTWKATVDRQTVGSTLTTTRTSFSLVAVGHGWDVGRVTVTGSVAPNATRSFEFTITAPETTTKRNYVYQWQMARATVVIERPIRPRSPGTFGAATPSRTIQVGPDTAPSFGNEMIENQEWLRGKTIDLVTLPAATGGNGALSYSLVTCYLPEGVTYDRAGKRISGTPRTAWGPTTCTWKVTDSDDNTAASDADTLEFTIWVRRPVLTVSPTELTVDEGGSGTFTVRPAMQPAGTVTVSVSSRDTGVAGVSPASLVFNAANYSTPKTVTVTGKEDVDGLDESTAVRLSASGGGYNNVSASVDVMVDDSYEPPVVPSSVTVGEGDSEPFAVALATQPTGTVTVSVSSGDTEVAGVRPARLTFTATDYSAPKTVTVTGVQDPDASNERTTVEVAANGGGYSGESASVDVTVIDDDIRGVIVIPASLTVNEGGSRGTFTVALATQPTGTVTVRVWSGDIGAATVSTASLSFTTSNYSRWQTVTVTGEDDADASNERTSITLDASGGGYGNESASVRVTVDDDDERGLLVSPAKLTLDEVETGSFTVALATQPTGTVTVRVWSGDIGAATVSTASLSFTTSNYSRWQTVTVTGVQDADASNERTSITLDASGGGYGNESASVSVTVIDPDEPDLVVMPTSLTVDEGFNDTFKVKLATQPTGTVTVSVWSGDTGAATVSTASLSFTTSNYSRWQTVTVTGEDDADASNERTSITLDASGGGYGNESASVSVTVIDPDEPDLVVMPTSLTVDEGFNDTFKVKLATQPTGTVTVSVWSGDIGAATVSTASLSFTTSNYSRWQDGDGDGRAGR